MVRVALLLVLLAASSVSAADLPPGAVARLGDDRFRAGSQVTHLALSPDGKQFATVHSSAPWMQTLTVWDADTGRPVLERQINAELFEGFVWGPGGAFAVVRRAEPGQEGRPAKVFPDDFRVWDFTDPKAAPPLLPPRGIVERTNGSILDGPPKDGPEYTKFLLSADGTRVAARWRSADEKHAVHVFELKATDTATKLTRVGVIDLGAEGADEVGFSADGKELVTFRKLNDPERSGGRESTATVWDVGRGKPEKPVRVPDGERLALAPDGRSLVAFASDGKEWGFDTIPLAPPSKSPARMRQRVRWPLPRPGAEARNGGHAVFPTGEVLAVAIDHATLVIDLRTGKELGRLEGHATAPGAVAVSADGTRIATADSFGLVRLWDAKTFRASDDAPGHRAPVEHAELSPDGKRLLTWAADETVRLWDVATGKELRAFAGATADSRPVFASNGTAVIYSRKNALIARDLQTGLEVPLPGEAKTLKPRAALLATHGLSASAPRHPGVTLNEVASGKPRRTLTGHRGESRVLGFTPDGTKLLTAGGDHTVLVWDVRLQAVPLPDEIKKETSAAKLWDTLASGSAKDAYLAMSRLSREPDAAVKMAKMRLKPAAKTDAETDAGKLADCRAVELLEALGTTEARALLKELAGGFTDAFRTQEAKRALQRIEQVGYDHRGK